MKLNENQKQQILTLDEAGFKSRKIAEVVLGRASRKSTVNDFLSSHKAVEESYPEEGSDNPQILLFDIETSFQMFGGFGRFNQNFSESQVFENTKLLGACAKWLDSEDMVEVWPRRFENWSSDFEQEGMLTRIWKMLDRADYVIAHNAPFDTKMINAFFVLHGISKPSPYRVIDTLRIARQNFRFDSNKLDSLGKFLGIGRKTPHTGFDLWRQCVSGDTEAMKLMIEYCHNDVLLLEDVYMTLRAWDSKHPNLSIHYDDRHRCGVCRSEDLIDTGKKSYTNTQAYPLYVCQDCGAWHRIRKADKADSKTLMGVK